VHDKNRKITTNGRDALFNTLADIESYVTDPGFLGTSEQVHALGQAVIEDIKRSGGHPDAGKDVKAYFRKMTATVANKEYNAQTASNKRTRAAEDKWLKANEAKANQLTTPAEKMNFWKGVGEELGGVQAIKDSTFSPATKAALLGRLQGASVATKGKHKPWEAEGIPDAYFTKATKGIYPELSASGVENKQQINSAETRLATRAKGLYSSMRQSYPDLDAVSIADKAIAEAKKTDGIEYKNLDPNGKPEDPLKPVTIKGYEEFLKEEPVPVQKKWDYIEKAIQENPNAYRTLNFAPGVNTPTRRKRLAKFNTARLNLQRETGTMEIPNYELQPYLTPEIRAEAEAAGLSASAYYSGRLEANGFKPLSPNNVATQEELSKASDLGRRAGSGWKPSSVSHEVYQSDLNKTYQPASHVRPGDASIVAELDYRHAGHGLNNPDKAHGDWNIKVKGGTQRDHNKATEFLYDVFKGLGIVATEVKGRDGVGKMHVPGSEHYLGNKMDVPFRGQTYSSSGPTTDADRALYHNNRELADTILTLYNQGNTNPEQVIRMIRGNA
jgi:hypothetical protein